MISCALAVPAAKTRFQWLLLGSPVFIWGGLEGSAWPSAHAGQPQATFVEAQSSVWETTALLQAPHLAYGVTEV